MIVTVADDWFKKIANNIISDQSECVGAEIGQSDYFAFHFIP